MSGGAIGAVGETVGATAGGIAGGFVGGAVGSVFGPVGTVAGRFAGARVGQWGGRALGGYLASRMEDANEKAEPKARDQDNTTDQAADECIGKCNECDKLNNEVNRIMKKIERRYNEMKIDSAGMKKGAEPQGVGTWEGYVQSFNQLKVPLRKAINKSKRNGCAPPEGGEDWLDRDAPSREEPTS